MMALTRCSSTSFVVPPHADGVGHFVAVEERADTIDGLLATHRGAKVPSDIAQDRSPFGIRLAHQVAELWVARRTGRELHPQRTAGHDVADVPMLWRAGYTAGSHANYVIEVQSRCRDSR